jgi:hypothetical protein
MLKVGRMNEGGEISLLELLRTLLKGWRSLAIAIALGVVLGVVANHLTERSYVASAFVSPVSQSDGGMNLGGLSTVASLAGINLKSGSGGDDPFSEFQVLLGSPIFAAKFEQKHHYLKRFFPSAWDEQTHTMRAMHHSAIGYLIRFIAGANLTTLPPGPDSLAQILKTKIIFSAVEGTGIFSLSYMNKDPVLARDFLRDVIADANAQIKARKIVREQSSADYLRARLNQETSVEMRTALTSLITSEEQKLMILNSGAPSAADVLDGVSVTPVPTTPSYARIFIVPFLLCLVLGVLAAFAEGRIRASGRPIFWMQLIKRIRNWVEKRFGFGRARSVHAE